MHDLLRDLVVCLGAALAVVLLFRRLRLPTTAGFLLAGILIGPSGLALIEHSEEVEHVAEVGIALLLFTIGLEVSLSRLVRHARLVLGAGTAQLALTAAFAAPALAAWGLGRQEALLLGLAASLSSTAIVFKILAERGEIGSPHGRLAVGVLLLQDLAVIPVLAVLSPGDGSGAAGAVGPLLRALAGMAAVLLAGRLVMTRLFAHVVRSGSRETFTLLVVFLLIGTELVADALGLSLAMGAFLAGLIISESEYGPQAMAEIFPVKETFSGLFFTSVGMLLDLGFAARHAAGLLALAGAVLVLKALLAAAACRLVQPSWRISFAAGIALAQVGEFALVIGAAGRQVGAVSESSYQVLLAVTVLTMLVSPFTVSKAHGMALAVARRIAARRGEPPPLPDAASEGRALRGHVVIVGYGLNGANLARVLTATHIPYLVLDVNPVRVEEGRRAGHEVRYGDGTLHDVLGSVDIAGARVLVVAISDPMATRQIVSVARRASAGVHIVVRTRFFSELEELRRLGADDVVAEEFETSVEIFTRVLRELLVPRNVIAIQVDLVRREGYGMLRGLSMPSRLTEQLPHILAASAVDNVQLLDGSPAIGQTVGGLRLRERTGTSIVAVIRGGRATTNPPPAFRFQAGDVLVLIGAHAEVDAADRALGPEPEETGPRRGEGAGPTGGAG